MYHIWAKSTFVAYLNTFQKILVMKNLKIITIFSILLVVLFTVSCQKESMDDDGDEDTEETTGGNSSGSAKEGTWARNDGQGTAYLRLIGTSAITCVSGTTTFGSYDKSASTMTFLVGNQTIVFPLSTKNGKLIVGVPAQGSANNQPTEYVETTTWPCGGSGGGGTGTGGGTGGGGGTTPPAKGSIIVWTNMTEYGWPQGFNGMGVTVSSVGGIGSTIYGGRYTSAPECGATYCYTVKVDPGQHTVYGKIYFLKQLDGTTPPPYSTSKTVTVASNQCVSVMLR